VAPAAAEGAERLPADDATVWDESAWRWALRKYKDPMSRVGKFEHPGNLEQDIRQAQTKLIRTGLQQDLSKILGLEILTDEDRKKAESLKKEINDSGRLLDKNRVSVSAIRKFSPILRRAKDLIDKYLPK
jgi:hypothetical protein